MAATPSTTRAPLRHRRLDRAAVGAATVAVLMVATGVTTMALVGFNADDEDYAGWRGVVAGGGLFGGVLVSILAFVLALVAKLRREHWAWLWFPLLLAPALIVSLPLWFE